MAQLQTTAGRRTSADAVFDHLYHEIVTLQLMPGTKMSEVEIANQFEVSRQPVREAFSRLGNLGLVLIRPQKATVVRKFSATEIAHARFVRTAVEVEVQKRALERWKQIDVSAIRANIASQENAVNAHKTDLFHELDYEFHKLLCEAADSEFAFATIAESKTKVDRLCMLSLGEPTEMAVLLSDHHKIIAALDDQDLQQLEKAVRAHLARLDSVVSKIQSSHAEYFE